MYTRFLERIYHSSTQIKEKVKAASMENLRLKEQLLSLQREYSQSQQIVMALTTTRTLQQTSIMTPFN